MGSQHFVLGTLELCVCALYQSNKAVASLYDSYVHAVAVGCAFALAHG